ncbi:MAG: Maf family protein [Myxococcota bacterium]
MTFEVRPAHADETPLPGEDPRVYARRIARAKATAVAGDAVLAADTVVALDGRIFGKPGDPPEARAMLRALSGRTHLVHTAVCLRASRTYERLVTSRVTFRALTERDVAWYLATGEPFDKAGGYGIQGDGALLVDRLQGSYTNVMGLPLRETLALLDRIAR